MTDQELKEKYWDGKFNHACRYWFYLNRGIDIFNQFKYLFALFIGIYLTLKLKNPLWLIGMIVVSMPILLFLGWLQVNRVGKILDYLNVKFSTHFGMLQITLLEEIRDELKKRP